MSQPLKRPHGFYEELRLVVPVSVADLHTQIADKRKSVIQEATRALASDLVGIYDEFEKRSERMTWKTMDGKELPRDKRLLILDIVKRGVLAIVKNESDVLIECRAEFKTHGIVLDLSGFFLILHSEPEAFLSIAVETIEEHFLHLTHEK